MMPGSAALTSAPWLKPGPLHAHPRAVIGYAAAAPAKGSAQGGVHQRRRGSRDGEGLRRNDFFLTDVNGGDVGMLGGMHGILQNNTQLWGTGVAGREIAGSKTWLDHLSRGLRRTIDDFETGGMGWEGEGGVGGGEGQKKCAAR